MKEVRASFVVVFTILILLILLGWNSGVSRVSGAPAAQTAVEGIKHPNLRRDVGIVGIVNNTEAGKKLDSKAVTENSTESGNVDIGFRWRPSFRLSGPGRYANGSGCLVEVSECWGDSMCGWYEICKRVDCLRTCYPREGKQWTHVIKKYLSSKAPARNRI